MIKTINKAKIFTYLLIFGLLISSCSQKVNNSLTVASNLKSLNIDEKNLDRIDSLLGSALINNWTAGVTALVAKDGKVFYYKGMGFRDRESKALMRPNDLFRIASMTKPVVSVATMMLVEQGTIKLDDPISKYIPEFANMQVLENYNPADTSYTTAPANKAITIKHLLTHTSGLSYGFADKKFKAIYEKNNIPDLASTDKITIDSITKVLGKLPLAVQPDSEFHYGLSSDVLGRVIEVSSKISVDSFLRKNIFEPLEMKDTHFFLPASKKHRLSTMYSESRRGRLIKTPITQGKFNLNYPIEGAQTHISTGSGLVSNSEDYARFLQMILDKGTYNNKQILKPETIELMAQNQIGDLSVKKNKFGLGFEITTTEGISNEAKVGRLSWTGAFNTLFWIDPERKSIAILMTQVYPALHKKELFSKFETIVNETLDTPPKKK